MKISAKRFLCALLAGMVCLSAVLSPAYGRTVASASDYESFDETPIEDDMGEVDEDDLFDRAGEDLGILQKIKAKCSITATPTMYGNTSTK